jgi:hypothetical protein
MAQTGTIFVITTHVRQRVNNAVRRRAVPIGNRYRGLEGDKSVNSVGLDRCARHVIRIRKTSRHQRNGHNGVDNRSAEITATIVILLRAICVQPKTPSHRKQRPRAPNSNNISTVTYRRIIWAHNNVCAHSVLGFGRVYGR